MTETSEAKISEVIYRFSAFELMARRQLSRQRRKARWSWQQMVDDPDPSRRARR
jgi:hypothetical protein